MKASQFSDAQKAFILRQGNDGVPVADICRKAGISQATYFNWKKKYEGMQPPEMRRLKQLEDENTKLKKILADCRWIARCFRTSSAENCKACSQARAGDGGL
jgi:putative transposase